MTPRIMTVAEATFLDDAVNFVLAHMYEADGARCPCCGGTVKVKRYSVSGRQARELMTLYRHRPAPLHWRDWLTSSARMQCVLRFAGLIEQPTNDPEKPFNRSGEWSITQLGVDWINGDAEIPRFMYVLYNQLVGTSPETMTYREACQNNYTPEDAMVDVNPAEAT